MEIFIQGIFEWIFFQQYKYTIGPDGSFGVMS
jgi:hypothetical protein